MADPLWINADAGAPAYSANELRQAMALGVMFGGRLLGARSGVRPGGDQLRTSLAGSTITVRSGVCCIDPGLSSPQGPYWVAIPSDETHALIPADATNPRADIVIVRVYDHDEDSSGLRLARTEYLVGVPGPGAAEPAVPAGAIRVATIDVPRVGNGAPVVTDRRPWTVAPGGILPVATSGDIAAGVAGRYRDRLDNGRLERDTGAAWMPVADPEVFTDWVTFAPTWSSTGTQPALNNGSLVGRYKKFGRIAHFVIKLFWGSTTTGGTGTWQFGGIPSVIDRGFSDTMLTAGCYDSSATATYPAVAQLSGSGSPGVLRIGVHSSAGAHGSAGVTHPFAWASGDSLYISGTYQSAA